MMIKPPFLRRADRIAVVSPSYHLEDSAMDRALEAVRAMGFEPVLSPNARAVHLNRYSGTVEQRLSDLEWAYSDPSIKAILASRGGYGAIQLLPLSDRKLISSNPKWLIGYSDITCLHALSTISSVQSIHGPMGSFLAGENPDRESVELTTALLLGDIPSYRWQAERCVPGRAEGMLTGGNLATLAPLLGTAFDPLRASQNIVLFIEEVEESAHNIDRLLHMIALHGDASRVRGIICGDFTDCGDEYSSGSIEAMLDGGVLREVFGNIPVAFGFPAGHADRNFPLIEGSDCRLNVDERENTLVFV